MGGFKLNVGKSLSRENISIGEVRDGKKSWKNFIGEIKVGYAIVYCKFVWEAVYRIDSFSICFYNF